MDWAILFKKMAWISAEVIVSGTIVYLTDKNLAWVLVPILEGARNYIKHHESTSNTMKWVL